MNRSQKKEKTLPTHCKCPHCGHEMRLAPYVYGHWHDVLIGTCHENDGTKGCGKKFALQAGVAY